jgi:LysM repeat protein
MNKRSSALARAFAVAALICGVLVIVVVVAGSLGGGDDNGKGGSGSGGTAGRVSDGSGGEAKQAPKSYVVQNGDTLTSIAHDTGVSVARIQALNPGVDPQILISGEKLKLR